jgi:tetratricopeptide (TPR) repeat protein
MIDTLGYLKSVSNIKIVEAGKRLDLLNETIREAHGLVKQAKLGTALGRIQQVDPKGCYAGSKSVRTEIDDHKAKAEALVNKGDAVSGSKPKDAIKFYASAKHVDAEYPGLDQKTNDAKHARTQLPTKAKSRLPRKPGDAAIAVYEIALQKQAKGDLDGAIAGYTKAIELKSDNALAYYSRGTAKHLKGDLDGAIADYTKAIELEPAYEGLNSLARANASRAKGNRPSRSATLVDAAGKADIASVRSLLAGGANPNQIDDADVRGWTPLMAAAKAGSTDVAEALLQAHANVNAANEYGATALDVAIANGKSALAVLIEAAGGKRKGQNNDRPAQ